MSIFYLSLYGEMGLNKLYLNVSETDDCLDWGSDQVCKQMIIFIISGHQGGSECQFYFDSHWQP